MYSLYIDMAGSIIIAGFLLISGFNLLKNAILTLTDRTPLEIDEIKAIIKSLSLDIAELQRIRCRQAWSIIIIDLTITVDPAIKMDKLDNTIQKITRKLKEKYPKSQVNISPLSRAALIQKQKTKD